jgi:hypothetical protein
VVHRPLSARFIDESNNGLAIFSDADDRRSNSNVRRPQLGVRCGGNICYLAVQSQNWSNEQRHSRVCTAPIDIANLVKAEGVPASVWCDGI